jgi:hypothetical protein
MEETMKTKTEDGLRRGDMSVGYGCRPRGTKGHFRNVCALGARIITDAVDADTFIRSSEKANPKYEYRITLHAIHVKVSA